MFAKSPRCETPNASDQYHGLLQDHQPKNVEFPPTVFDRAFHIQYSDVRRKRSSSDPGPWTCEQPAKTLGQAVLPETISLKGQTPSMNNVDSLSNSNPVNILDSPVTKFGEALHGASPPRRRHWGYIGRVFRWRLEHIRQEGGGH